MTKIYRITPAPSHDYMRLKHFIEELLDREIDLVLRSGIRPQIKDNILTQVQYV